MAEKVEVVGGPLDGLKVAERGRFAILEQVVLHRREPGPDRHGYVWDGGAYVYAGRWVSCRCGAQRIKAEGGAEVMPCPLCGAEAPA